MSCFPFGAADGFDAAAVGFIAPTLKLPPARSAPWSSAAVTSSATVK